MIFVKKVITSAHSKSSNSSGFNPILQKFYKICEIIASKTVCRIFLIFCRSSFINNFMVKNSFSEPKNQNQKISRYQFIFLKNLHIVLEVLFVQINWKLFFESFFFQGLGAFFTTATRLIWELFFSQKNNFIIFFQG